MAEVVLIPLLLVGAVLAFLGLKEMKSDVGWYIDDEDRPNNGGTDDQAG